MEASLEFEDPRPAGLERSERWPKLFADFRRDMDREPKRADTWREKMAWIVSRATAYAEICNMSPSEVLDNWERFRDYWYVNYYQDSKFPLPEDGRVRVFDTGEDAKKAIEFHRGFRCPHCEGVSMDPTECTMPECDWKAWGFFGALGKGVYVVRRDMAMPYLIFMPVAWEGAEHEH